MHAVDLNPGSLVAIDGDAFSFPVYRAAFLSRQRWNGWANPYFSLEESQRIADATHHEDGSAMFDWEPVTGDEVPALVRFPAPGDDDDDEPERIAPVYVDGTPYWCVGGWSWCWSEVSDEDPNL